MLGSPLTAATRICALRMSPVFGLRLIGSAAVLATSLAVGAEAREARTPAWDKIAAGREAGKPVLAVIGLRPQKITIYDSEGAVLQAPVSTGRQTYETPAGVFTILQKNRDHVSNLYEDAEMPFMQRITWSGIALCTLAHCPALAPRTAVSACPIASQSACST